MKKIPLLILSLMIISCTDSRKQEVKETPSTYDSIKHNSCFEGFWSEWDKTDPGNPISNVEFNIDNIVKERKRLFSDLVGCKIPEFEVTTIDGKKLTSENLVGKVVVLNFWFTSCASCVEEIPALNKLVKEYQNKDVIFIAFAKSKTSELRDFLKVNKFDYNIVSSKYDMRKKFCIAGGYPTNMVFDKDGILRQILNAFIHSAILSESDSTKVYDEIKPTIDKYLQGK